jgi:putative heme-binding domain-containing protein
MRRHPVPWTRPVARAVLLRHAFTTAGLLLAGLAAATSLSAQAQDHGQYDKADAERGSHLYTQQCLGCHGGNGDLIAGVDLRLGRFRRVNTDDDLVRVISAGLPGTGMPGFRLQPAEMSGIVAFVRSGFDVASTTVAVGSAARGQALFTGKGECARCHRVNGVGPRTAPDLSDIGALRTLAALERALVQPSTAMLPINRPVRLVTKDGRTFAGRRLNEDTHTVQIIDDQERLRSVAKADLKTFELGTESPMPSYETRLTAAERADVIGYLVTLKGVR